MKTVELFLVLLTIMFSTSGCAKSYGSKTDGGIITYRDGEDNDSKDGNDLQNDNETDGSLYPYNSNRDKQTHDASSDFVGSRKYPGPCVKEISEGSTLNIIQYVYSKEGNVIREECDGCGGELVRGSYEACLPRDPDGQPDWVRTYSYDQNGNRLTEDCDGCATCGVNNADETIDSSYIWHYNDIGSLEAKEYKTDYGYSTYTVYTHDEEGNVIRKELDKEHDGTIEEVTEYHYDEHGMLSMEERERVLGTGKIISDKIMYTYEEGNLLTEEFDDNNDGDIDKTVVYSYDENGYLLSDETTISMNQGDRTETQRYTYDEYGNLLMSEYTEGPTGRTTYSYYCWDI